MDIIILPGILLGGIVLGIIIGKDQLESSLTICRDNRGVTGAHCLKGKFYYLVPESLWVAIDKPVGATTMGESYIRPEFHVDLRDNDDIVG